MRKFIIGVVLCALCSGPALAAPIEAYGQLPTLEDVKISPDGNRLAYVQQVGEDRVIKVTDLTGKAATVGISVTGKKLRDIIWAGNTHLLIATSTTAKLHNFFWGSNGEWYQIQCLDVVSGQQIDLMTHNTTMIANVASGAPFVRTINGDTRVLIPSFYPEQTFLGPALYSLSLDGGDAKIVESKSEYAEGWLVDSDGNTVVETDFDDQTKHWSLRIKVNGFWKEAVGRQAPIDEPEVAGLTEDGTGVVFKDIDKDTYQTVSLKDGTAGPPYEHADAGMIVRDSLTDRVLGAYARTPNLTLTLFTPDAQRAWKIVEASFPNCTKGLESHTPDWKKVVVHVDCSTFGDNYVLVDLTAIKAHLVGPEYQGIAAADYSEVKNIEYQAADGRTIMAYLTLPKGKDPKNLPLIVMPHGGPAARDEPGFDWWSEALASRGYAVLRPQYRGSQGFGEELFEAGFGEFGRKMQTDLSDGVHALAAQGVIDPKRVCIVGASYGGYAAMAGITLQTGIYRCAIADAGLSDLPAMLAWNQNHQARQDNQAAQYWDRYMGVTDPASPALHDISPIDHIANVDAPILLTHGTDDIVVELGQSQKMYDALIKAGKTAQFVKLEGEDHWLSTSKTRDEMLKVDMDFLMKYNPPD
jgi:dienelactone hydrolase